MNRGSDGGLNGSFGGDCGGGFDGGVGGGFDGGIGGSVGGSVGGGFDVYSNYVDGKKRKPDQGSSLRDVFRMENAMV